MTARETLALLRLTIPLLWTKSTEETGRTTHAPRRKPTHHDTQTTTRPKKPEKGAHR